MSSEIAGWPAVDGRQHSDVEIVQPLRPSENLSLGDVSPALIQAKCRQIQATWDVREKFLRKLRSEMAIQTGVCRNA